MQNEDRFAKVRLMMAEAMFKGMATPVQLTATLERKEDTGPCVKVPPIATPIMDAENPACNDTDTASSTPEPTSTRKEAAKQKRLEKNRESAKRSRDQKKMLADLLVKQNKDYYAKCCAMQKMLRELIPVHTQNELIKTPLDPPLHEQTLLSATDNSAPDTPMSQEKSTARKKRAVQTKNSFAQADEDAERSRVSSPWTLPLFSPSPEQPSKVVKISFVSSAANVKTCKRSLDLDLCSPAPKKARVVQLNDDGTEPTEDKAPGGSLPAVSDVFTAMWTTEDSSLDLPPLSLNSEDGDSLNLSGEEESYQQMQGCQPTALFDHLPPVPDPEEDLSGCEEAVIAMLKCLQAN